MYAFAADALLVFHLAFILFAVFGAALVVWRRRLAWLHLPALAWAVFIVASHGICPLTPLENEWRARAGQAGYEGGFIDHYIAPLIYPPGLTPGMQTALAIALAAWNVFLYGWAILRWRRSRFR